LKKWMSMKQLERLREGHKTEPRTPHASERKHNLFGKLDPFRNPKLPAISTCRACFLTSTQYMRKKRWLKWHTIKGRLPHPPVLSATADLEKSHANNMPP
jgi:hypothetical protein